jgi:hypothetical protein
MTVEASRATEGSSSRFKTPGRWSLYRQTIGIPASLAASAGTKLVTPSMWTIRMSRALMSRRIRSRLKGSQAQKPAQLRKGRWRVKH